MCRAKFLAVKEDFMLLAVGIISTSAFVLNPEHWKQVPSFLNKLAPHGGEKKKKKEACLCVLAQLGDRQATGRDAKEGTPSSLLAGSVHALVEGLWPSNSGERRALALLPACPCASASAQLERTQRDAASLATSSDPTRQLSPRAAAECCNKQPINHSELHSVAFFFFFSLLLW